MKKSIIYLAALLWSTTLCTSCSDVLDIDPSDRYSPASIWASTDAVDKYVIGFYAMLKESTEIYDASTKQFTDAYSDIMKSSSWDQYNHPYNMSLLQETYYDADDAKALSCWSGDSGCYNRIRRHNEFLRDAPNYIGNYGKEFVNARMAEVRFVRAYAYFRLIRVYGGVVLRTAVDGPAQNDKPRATEAESWDQVITDLQYAGANLPKSWDGGAGRVTKAAAYGMLSRAALYAKKWDIVIQAADSCTKYGGALAGTYAEVFRSSSNAENLLAVNFLPGYSTYVTHRADSFFRPIGDSKTHGNTKIYGALTPTSELVDSYEMEGTLGEFSWTKYGTDPYAKREPRFYASILYNGAMWEGRTIETFLGGADGMIPFSTSGAAGSTTTGYYLRKFITENDHTWDTEGSSHFAPLLRYAEVMLNKAEALAEQSWGENSAAALSALNDIRGRVGLPARTAANKEKFMEYLRHERKVELAGEGFRFWDLRRWRLAVETLNGTTAHGVKVTKTEGGFNYEQIEVDAGKTRIFFDRYYAFSIPLAERANNKLLGANNPGW